MYAGDDQVKDGEFFSPRNKIDVVRFQEMANRKKKTYGFTIDKASDHFGYECFFSNLAVIDDGNEKV